MEIIIHRVNKIQKLKKIDQKYGVEIDIRALGSELILNHEPFKEGEKLIDYLDEYNHGTLVLNVKEDGIEENILQMVKQRSQIKSFFLLDVEFPYLYRESRKGEKNIAVRFSEDESIETVKNYVGMVDWVWIDTNTKMPISNNNKNILKNFKNCLVCPERWGRPYDIKMYKQKLDSIGFVLDSVMTSLDCKSYWE